MPSPFGYEPVLSSKASGFLVGLSRPRQRRLINLLLKLATNPNQVGDYTELDDHKREVHFILIQDLLIAYWPDHAVKELRIVDIEEV